MARVAPAPPELALNIQTFVVCRHEGVHLLNSKCFDDKTKFVLPKFQRVSGPVVTGAA